MSGAIASPRAEAPPPTTPDDLAPLSPHELRGMEARLRTSLRRHDAERSRIASALGAVQTAISRRKVAGA